jgi:hypothetical protein
MVVMARRSKRNRPSWRDPEATRLPSLGAHWRADGAPKRAYASQAEALSVSDERRRESGADLNVYRCEYCHAWHMGNRGARGSRTR